MPDAFIPASDAADAFPRLLKVVEEGSSVTITRDGKPVAVLSPAPRTLRRSDPEFQAAWEQMVAMMEKGLDIGYDGKLDRDELHARSR